MARSPELWVFIATNSLSFISGSVLMILSYIAYYQNPRYPSYRYSTIGFGFIVLCGLVSPVYRFGIRSNYHFNANQRLLLRSGESILLAIGLGLLFYAIMRHDADLSTVDDYGPIRTNYYEFEEQRRED